MKNIILVIGLFLFAGIVNTQTARKWDYSVGTEELSILDTNKTEAKEFLSTGSSGNIELIEEITNAVDVFIKKQ